MINNQAHNVSIDRLKAAHLNITDNSLDSVVKHIPSSKRANFLKKKITKSSKHVKWLKDSVLLFSDHDFFDYFQSRLLIILLEE